MHFVKLLSKLVVSDEPYSSWQQQTAFLQSSGISFTKKKKNMTVQVTPLLNLNLCNALISCLLVSWGKLCVRETYYLDWEYSNISLNNFINSWVGLNSNSWNPLSRTHNSFHGKNVLKWSEYHNLVGYRIHCVGNTVFKNCFFSVEC